MKYYKKSEKILAIIFFYILFSLLDVFIWLGSKLLPGRFVLDCIRDRPWGINKIKIKEDLKYKIRGYIYKLIDYRSRYNLCGSSCLSRSICGRIILDQFSIKNQLNLGVSKLKNGRKIPHAWLNDPTSQKFPYNSLNKSKVIFLISL